MVSDFEYMQLATRVYQSRSPENRTGVPAWTIRDALNIDS